MPKDKRRDEQERGGIPYDETPMLHLFPGVPESCFDLLNEYGTFELQPTCDTENEFPAIAQGLPDEYEPGGPHVG